MIDAKLFKIDDSGWSCNYPNCSHKYHDQILNTYYLKLGTTCLMVSLNYAMEVYCPSCADILFKRLRPILDTKLWIF